MRRVAAGGLAVAVLISGCWGRMVRQAPNPLHVEEPFDCTASRAGPIADLAISGGMLLLFEGIYVAAIEDCKREADWGLCDPDMGFWFSAGLFISVPIALSAWAGFRRTERCRRAKVLRARHLAEGRESEAGSHGHECRLTLPGEEISACDRGARCTNGRCVPFSHEEKLRRHCGPELGRWNAERDPTRRAELFSALPERCRELVPNDRAALDDMRD